MADSVRSQSRQVNPLQALALLVTFVLLAGVGGLLAAGLVLPLAAGTSAVTDGAVHVFDELPDELEPKPLSQQSILLDSKGKKITNFYIQNRVVVPLDKVSMPMQNAVVAIEDKRFFSHGGVDVEGMARAFLINAVTEKRQGASTLTQQYVKNVLIEQAVRDGDELAEDEARADTYERKLREAKVAVSLEQRMSKLEILEGYLNIAQFGASVYGVESASRFYFNKSASKLTNVEAATIAGITKAPNKYDPTREGNLAFATTRRNTVLDAMYQQGYMTKDEHAAARKTKVEDTLNVNPAKNSCEAAGGAGYFCDYVTKVIESDPAFGETKAEREDLLKRGGLTIHTTLDSSLQKKANKVLRETIPTKDPTGLADAMVSIRPETGEILVMAQNRKFVANGESAKAGQTTVNYAADQAHGGSKGFQAGSTFKPFVLAEWLRSGRSLSATVDATKKPWPNDSWKMSCVDGRFTGPPYNPGNSDGSGTGMKTVMQATATSINTAYTAMLNQLDLCDVADTAEMIGFRPSAAIDEGQVTPTPSMVLGTQNTSPLSMASAYATFANGGKYCEPVAITKITGPDGQELELPKANCRAVLDAKTANGVTHALVEVLENGGARGSKLADGRIAAGKTGSTQSNMHTWFVGYTPQLSTAVWIGHPDRNVPMQRIVINDVYYTRVYGSTLAAPTWRNFMNQALAGKPKQQFSAVDRKTLEGEKLTVPRLWGMSPADAEIALKRAGFEPVISPGQVNSTARQGSVAYTSPSGTSTRGTAVTIFTSNGTPPAPEPEDEPEPDKKKDKSSKGSKKSSKKKKKD